MPHGVVSCVVLLIIQYDSMPEHKISLFMVVLMMATLNFGVSVF